MKPSFYVSRARRVIDRVCLAIVAVFFAVIFGGVLVAVVHDGIADWRKDRAEHSRELRNQEEACANHGFCDFGDEP